jgi:hypothetical protein
MDEIYIEGWEVDDVHLLALTLAMFDIWILLMQNPLVI